MAWVPNEQVMRDVLGRWEVEDVPVYLAARGPRMLEVAGEVADGVITHGLARSYVDLCTDLRTRGVTTLSEDERERVLVLVWGNRRRQNV